MNTTEIHNRLLEVCDFEPVPADVLERIQRRLQLEHASRYPSAESLAKRGI